MTPAVTVLVVGLAVGMVDRIRAAAPEGWLIIEHGPDPMLEPRRLALPPLRVMPPGRRPSPRGSFVVSRDPVPVDQRPAFKTLRPRPGPLICRGWGALTKPPL